MNKIIIKDCSKYGDVLVSEYLKNKDKLSSINNPIWIEVLHKSYKTKKIYFVAYKNNSICGVFSGYIVTNLKFSKNLHSLKEGLVADSDFIYSMILDYINSFCKKNKIDSFLTSTGEYRLEESHYKTITKKILKIQIPKTEDECWSSLSTNIRKNLRQVLKQGFFIDTDKDNLKFFYKIYANSMAEKKVPIHSFIFFENLFKQFGNFAELITLKKDNNVVGGIVLIRSSAHVYCSYQSSDRFFAKYELNNLLIWESIKHCIDLGISCLHMGEATIDGGVYKFKIRVGAEPFDSFYYTNIKNIKRKSNRNSNEFVLEQSSFNQFKNYVFNFLPIFLLRPIFIFLKKRAKML